MLIGLAIVIAPVEQEQSEGEAEPDADEAQLLDVVGQQVVDHFQTYKQDSLSMVRVNLSGKINLISSLGKDLNH